MVLARRYRERRNREEREAGRKEGIRQERARWEAWSKQRDEAIRNNLPFDEPNPAEVDGG